MGKSICKSLVEKLTTKDDILKALRELSKEANRAAKKRANISKWNQKKWPDCDIWLKFDAKMISIENAIKELKP